MSYIEPTNKLWSELAGIAAEEGLRLYDAERAGQKGLRVFVQREQVAAEPTAEKSAAPTGATSEDCVRLCRRLMRYFMVEGPELGLGTEPFIEVSSPGLNRMLRLSEHFGGALGEMADLHLSNPVVDERGSERNHFVGRIAKVADGKLDLALEDGKEISFPLSQIKKARVKF